MAGTAGIGRVQAVASAVVVWCMLVTVSRAIRLPNEYCSAHWLLDYRFGFMKRGLIGSLGSAVTSITGTTMSYTAISVLAGIGFAAFFLAVGMVVLRLLRGVALPDGAILMALVFAASPFFVMYSHTFGAFDAILFALTIATIGLMLSGRLAAAGAVQVVAVLIHEIYILTGFPVVCLAAILICSARGRGARWMPHGFALAGPVAVFLFIVAYHSLFLDAQVLRGQLEAHLASFPFLSEPGLAVAEFHTIGFFEYFRYQRAEFFERLLDPLLLGVAGPSLLVLVYGLHARFAVVPFSPLSIAVLGAVLAPLSMHAVAWDTERITIFTLGNAFLALWVLSETREAANRDDAWLPILAIPALLLGIAVHVPLMEGETERLSQGLRWVLYAPGVLLAVAVVAGRPPWQEAWKGLLSSARTGADRWRGGGRGG